ncbi:MAG: PAS domain S-box protein, partial [Pseudomonadota bacterium]
MRNQEKTDEWLQLEKAHDELRLIEERYRAIFYNAAVGIDLVSAEGCFLQANATLQDMLGYTEEELKGLSIIDITFPEDRQISQEKLDALTKGTLNSYRIEKRYVRKDGSLLWADISISAIRGSDGRHIVTIGVISDITERKRMEEALRTSEERFRGMFEKHSAVMLLIEPMTGRIVDANKAAERFYGYTVSQLLSMSIQDINVLPPDEVEAQRNLALKEQRNYFVFPHRLANGDVRTVEVHSSPIEQEGTVLLFTIIRDITERKQAEEALESANAYNRTLIETSVDPLVTIGPDGRISDVNTATEKVTGYSRAELIGTNFSDYFTEPDKATARYQQVFQDGAVRDYELEIQHRDGHVTPFTYSASVYRDKSGEVVGVFAAARDITDRKRLEEEKLDMERKRLHAQKLESLAVMAGGIAHDFNNQLAV